MTSMRVAQLDDPARWALTEEQKNFGCLRTQRGALPLNKLQIQATVRGLDYSLNLSQEFVNVHSDSLEAVYIFPLPGRAAVSAFRMICGDRVVEAHLRERGQARAEYRAAVQAGQQAAMLEEERPEIFTVTLGNLPAGQTVSVQLDLVGPLRCQDDHLLLRFPLVVGPRYIPGTPLTGKDLGQGIQHDTNQVPDASRISPPRLLPGYPNPVQLSLEVEVDSPLVQLDSIRASLPLEIQGNRLIYPASSGAIEQDFILAIPFPSQQWSSCLMAQGETFCLTLVPPAQASQTQPARHIVILMDRSSSMSGWPIAATRRVIARLVHSLHPQDRFKILAFDDKVEAVEPRNPGWYRAGSLTTAIQERVDQVLQALSEIEPRGGTEMKPALETALGLLEPGGQIVLVTDGQVGNETEIYELCARHEVRISSIGISQSVNAEFLQRLAESTGGLCQLVHNDEQLDQSMTAICQRIGNPILRNLEVPGAQQLVYQHRDLYPGLPTRIYGKLPSPVPDCLEVTAQQTDGQIWSQMIPVSPCTTIVEKLWARERVLQLEHDYWVGRANPEQVISFSLQHGVLCRFTTFLSVDDHHQVPLQRHSQVQPVPSGGQSIRVDLLPTEKRGMRIPPLLALLLMPLWLPILVLIWLWRWIGGLLKRR